MGKIIGNKTVSVKTYTEEEVNVLTKELNEKIAELTVEKNTDSDEKSSSKKSKKDE